MPFKPTHGMTGTPVYRSWAAMMTRCYNFNTPQFVQYGGVGKVACEFIRSSPLNIVLLIGHRPEGMSLDRTDNKGNYTCGDCAECLQKGWLFNIRWATRTMQNRNQESGRWITIDGVTKCLSEWAEISGISYRTLCFRVNHGWTGRRLISSVRPKTAVNIEGVVKTVPEWSRASGVSIEAIRSRIGRGISGVDLIKPVISRCNSR